tara:strand:- start:241 stop:405 length:165 start_codon:yes stop_codon:yes gene_type:complete
MAKSYRTGKKSSFSQKRKNLTETEELRESGMYELLSNRQKLYSKQYETDETYDF